MNSKQEKQLEIARNVAASNNGKCLSTEYTQSKSKLLWKCSNFEHKPWLAAFDGVVYSKSWCPECFNEIRYKNKLDKNGLERAKNYASSRGGKCLSNEYINAKTALIWKCSNPEHKEWKAPFDSVLSNKTWCPACAKKNILQRGLNDAKEHARIMGGECLSEKYNFSNEKLLWKCANPNHEPWLAIKNRVVSSNSWCPKCAKNKLSEKRVRLIFERFFGKAFPSVKPTWNINPWTNKLLELDGYCKEFNIAFEHDGQHHFEISNYNGCKRTLKELIYQQFKDHQKQKNCIKQGILLINIQCLDGNKAKIFKQFITNVIESCKPHGIDMQFTQQQLKQLEQDFYLVE